MGLKQSLAPVLALVLFSAGLVSAAPRNAHIVIGGRELVLAPLSVVDDGAVYAPVQVLDYLGCAYRTDEEKHTVTIVTANLAEKTVRTVALGEHEMLPMNKVIEIVGGTTSWNEFTRTLTILAGVKSVEFVEGRLIISLSTPSAFKIKYWPNPDRLAVDISGAKLATAASEISIGSEDVQRARLGQFDEQTARVVLDLSRRVGYRVLSEAITNRIEIEIRAGIPQPKPAQASTAAAPTAVSVTGVTADIMEDDRARIHIATDGRPSTSFQLLRSPICLCVDMPRAKLATKVTDVPVGHPLVERVRLGDQFDSKPGVRAVMDLTRYAAYSVISTDDTGVVLEVRMPEGAGGLLRDKTIVIDPGHGGPQRGASYGGVSEKTLNLQLSKRLARRLEEEGARVILTRDGDYNLDPTPGEDLRKRPALATEHGADLFISIHCNALGVRTPPSGTETYYLYNKSDSLALASAVHEAVIKGTGMTCRKVRPDSQLFKGRGLAVLRNSTVPAILIETGYMDNKADLARLVKPEFQEKFAAAVVDGLRMYIEGKTGGSQ